VSPRVVVTRFYEHEESRQRVRTDARGSRLGDVPVERPPRFEALRALAGPVLDQISRQQHDASVVRTVCDEGEELENWVVLVPGSSPRQVGSPGLIP
jgi:hypothetical protein